MEWSQQTIKIALALISFVSGCMLSMAAAYVVAVKDIAYIKGQLASLLKFHEKLSKLYDRQVVLEKDMSKAKMDLNQAHEKIRKLAGGG